MKVKKHSIFIITIIITIVFLSSFVLSIKTAQEFVGYAVSSVDQNSVKSIQCFGFADKENSIKYDTSTLQNIGSVSKTLIGLSLMIAKDQGWVDLDQNINDYLDFEVVNPHIAENNKITLRHLATHTSGITDNNKFYKEAYSKGYEPHMELGAYLEEYLTRGGSKFSNKNYAKAKAGDRYQYSNIGAALAAYVLEKATGVPFDKFTENNILEPLKMQQSGWSYSAINLAKHAVLYDEKGKPLPPYTLITYPDGGFRTSINDLSIYLKELIKGYHHRSTLLSNAAWDEFYKKNFSPEDPVENVDPQEPNTGIFILYSKSGKIGHTGSDPGASTIMWFDPETHEGHIFMANKDITKKNVAEFTSIWKALTLDNKP